MQSSQCLSTMNRPYLFLISLLMSSILSLFDFTVTSDLNAWQVVNDGVMGGKSIGDLRINNEGNGEFSGTISLANNGGFASIRTRFPKLDVSEKTKVVLRVKGDGKRYQLRFKTDITDRHSYIVYFNTSDSWQTIKLAIKEMRPSFRGMMLSQPNYPGVFLEEISLLIGNKTPETFQLEIDYIRIE